MEVIGRLWRPLEGRLPPPPYASHSSKKSASSRIFKPCLSTTSSARMRERGALMNAAPRKSRLRRSSARLCGSPLIGAGLECRHCGDIRRGRPVLEILRQERPQHVLAEPARSVATEAQIPQAAALIDRLAVVPRPQNQLDHAAVHVLGLDCLVHSNGAVAVLGIPQTVN